MKQVGYGIIGAGNIAALHAKALSALKNAELVAVYDRNTAAAKRLAEEYGCRILPGLQNLPCRFPDSGGHNRNAIGNARGGGNPLRRSRQACVLRKTVGYHA